MILNRYVNGDFSLIFALQCVIRLKLKVKLSQLLSVLVDLYIIFNSNSYNYKSKSYTITFVGRFKGLELFLCLLKAFCHTANSKIILTHSFFFMYRLD